ncbi:hypothetical protein TNIN_34031 [Trichonephila inaurata madagascariensis]|uniref:Uncharacterized protein n=1 Tax=Trichonephila inaurata madagascariensis TaxID=2747483 RepID=A0A8X6IC43_9ARAC|nr:hypothetical protein TNIN_34031 [Trichonephila inaurata madagascariensis]
MSWSCTCTRCSSRSTWLENPFFTKHCFSAVRKLPYWSAGKGQRSHLDSPQLPRCAVALHYFSHRSRCAISVMCSATEIPSSSSREQCWHH